MHKVLITGATGFLGKYAIKEFSDNNYQVVGFGRRKVSDELLSMCYDFYYGDFTELEDINKAVEGVDIVVHAGALSDVWGSWKNFYNANVKGTQNVINACLKNGVKKLIFVSSPSIYTEDTDRLNIKEDDFNPNNKLNYYIETKIMCENIMARIDRSKIYTSIIRPRGLIGVGDKSIIPRLIRINKKIGIPLFNNGQNLVDMTSVENVALALRLCAEKDTFNGHVYNITNGEPRKFKEILEKLFDYLNIKPKYLNLRYT